MNIMLFPGLADSVVDHPEVHGRPSWAKEAGPGSENRQAGTLHPTGTDFEKGQTSQPHGRPGSGKYPHEAQSLFF